MCALDWFENIFDFVLQSDFQTIMDHPFKTSAIFKGGGVKNLPNLPMDSTKKLPTVGR